MNWAIVFYALIAPLDGGEASEHISWGLTFGHHEQCITFFERNKSNLLEGLATYASQQFDQPIKLQEIGCAHARADFSVPAEDRTPELTLKMPVWNGTET